MVFLPSSSIVMRSPRAEISQMFQRPPAFGAGCATGDAQGSQSRRN
jgi:hypothetical protein